MEMTILFIIVSILLLGAIYALWRYWETMVQMSPEEQAYDKRVARLNERQANRLSDEQLSNAVSGEDAWQVMVRRGQEAQGKRQRYAGNLERRTRERRRE
jgi:predicted negative regulator of RcsB-dependent stress response